MRCISHITSLILILFLDVIGKYTGNWEGCNSPVGQKQVFCSIFGSYILDQMMKEISPDGMQSKLSDIHRSPYAIKT